MAVTDSSITTTTATNFIPQIWSTEALESVEFAAGIQKRVLTEWKDEMSVGSVFNIPRVSNLTTQSKSSGVSNTIREVGGLVGYVVFPVRSVMALAA